jgi:hypothetical protein
MSDPEQRHWTVEIFRVANQDRQQVILTAFRAVERADVNALGTQSGNDWFVVVETSSPEDRFLVRTIISTMDSQSTRAYSFRASRVLGPMPA